MRRNCDIAGERQLGCPPHRHVGCVALRVSANSTLSNRSGGFDSIGMRAIRRYRNEDEFARHDEVASRGADDTIGEAPTCDEFGEAAVRAPSDALRATNESSQIPVQQFT
jgi:hypothetical protein